jgi:uncharacterized repeat protein (TIGR01451 family)
MKPVSKRVSIVMSAAALTVTMALVNHAPVMAGFKQMGAVIAQALNRPQIKLNLSAEKQIVSQDQKGQKMISWKALAGKVTVNPGDVLRYTVTGRNEGDRPAKKFVVTQPIPKQMIYVLGSATNNSNAKTTYSIDNGKSFVEKPTVQIRLANGQVETRPAPAEAYTHIRWNFGDANPKATVNAMYQVKVR